MTIEAAADGLTYQLYLDADLHLIVKQGEQKHRFHHLESAVVDLLSLLGEFSERKAEA